MQEPRLPGRRRQAPRSGTWLQFIFVRWCAPTFSRRRDAPTYCRGRWWIVVSTFLIRGSGVQVSGGASVLTWSFILLQSSGPACSSVSRNYPGTGEFALLSGPQNALGDLLSSLWPEKPER